MKNLIALAIVGMLCCSAPLVSKAQGAQDHTRMLTGRVFDRQDAPVSKAGVYLKNTKSLAVTTYISDADGRYRVPALSPNVDYEVYAGHNGAQSDTKTISAFDNRKLINITLRIK